MASFDRIEEELSALETGGGLQGTPPVLELELEAFNGPLDLLLALIDKQKIDIYDIPIASITEQYMAYLAAMVTPDMDVASDFLVMAATLLQIKSRLLLPKQKVDGEWDDDPRGELVLRLLEYRRCRLLAEELKKRRAMYADCSFRLPESAAHLGIDLAPELVGDIQLVAAKFFKAASSLNERNTLRFNDLSERLKHILRREKVSLLDKLRLIWRKLRQGGQFLFSDLFPKKAGKTERVTAFLAVLELLRGRRIDAKQTGPFEPIELFLPERSSTSASETDRSDEAEFSEWIENSELGKEVEAYGN